MGLKIPKVMIAAVKSGSGKTTVTCAFLKQLLCRKKHPVSFKCGPDYIDPMFHEQVLKIPSKNLDTFFSDASQIQALYEMELPGHDIAVLEGVMGLYDGLGGIREEGSSYHLAKTLDVPVILVVDAHGMGKSVIPLIAGFLQYDEKKLIKGVILNRTSKMFFDTIAPLIEEELAIKALGCKRTDNRLQTSGSDPAGRNGRTEFSVGKSRTIAGKICGCRCDDRDCRKYFWGKRRNSNRRSKAGRKRKFRRKSVFWESYNFFSGNFQWKKRII